MPRDAPLPANGTIEKIFQLEDQVKGLMETINQLHQVYNLGQLNIPRPDQYVRTGGYTMGDMYDRIPSTNPAAKAALRASATQKAAQEVAEAKKKSTVTASEIPSLAPYKYSPLSTESSEIRLLVLQASTSLTDPIMCRLVTVSLDSPLRSSRTGDPLPIGLYTPLSYCWGTTSGKKPIVVDGQSFLVTPSLYTALLHFRKADQNPPDAFRRRASDGETYWWIDAICINQNDLDERNTQVGLMTRVYKQAQVVHVWLGEESDDSARAMQTIRELAYLPKYPEEIATWNYIAKPGQTHRPDGPGRPKVQLPKDLAPISEEEKLKNYRALINLYQRPWFSRVWIRQEVALPGSVKFHCGTETCEWSELMRAADLMAYLADEFHLPALQQCEIRQYGSSTSCFAKATELNDMREQTYGGDRYLELESLVLRSRDCQATDPRDKVFAMLPLTNPDKTEIAADYRKDPHEVYKSVALAFIQSNMDYLAGCQNPTRSNGLPSWVPNLETPWDALASGGNAHQTDLENWPSQDINPPQFTYSPEQSRLDVQGVIFDQIGVIDHESYLTADTSNMDVHNVAAQWKEFYLSQRDELFRSWEDEDAVGFWDKRDQCDNVFDTFETERSWEYRVVNTGEGKYRRRGRDDRSRFQPWNENIDHDPTLTRARRLLPSESAPFSTLLTEKDDFTSLRALAVGRRCVTTSKGAIALAPIAAQTGDTVCFFDGSNLPFVIRKAGDDDTWVIVGQAHYFGRIVLGRSKPKLKKTIIRLV